MRESIEKKEEKPTVEILEEIRNKEMEAAKEEKSSTAWNTIIPSLLIPELLETYDLLSNGEPKLAGEKLKEAAIALEKIKDKERKLSNENFIHLYDDKINTQLAKKQLESERSRE